MKFFPIVLLMAGCCCCPCSTGPIDLTVDGGSSTCTAGQTFCSSGTQLTSCPLSGHDAIVTDCKAAGTPTNPGVCAAVDCPSGGASSCCRPGLPVCSWDIVGSISWKGKIYVPHGSSSGAFCASSWKLGSVLSLTIGVPLADSGASDTLAISFDRSKLADGKQVILPSAGTSVVYSAHACDTWNGTITMNGDVPNYSVTLDLHCLAPSSFKLSGTIQVNL